MEVADLAGKPVAKVFKGRSQVIRQHLALDFEFIKLIWEKFNLETASFWYRGFPKG